MNARRILSATALTLALAVAGCSTGDDVQTKTEAEAGAAVRQFADQVATTIGGVTFDTANTVPSPCEGGFGETNREIFTMQGSYQWALPTDRQLDTIARVRESWRASGYEITEERKLSEDRGAVNAKTPDGFNLYLFSTTPPTGMGVVVTSPCYRSPTPRP
jgi:hypothetical protein